MISPVNAKSRLVAETLAEGLSVMRCPRSGGVWIRPAMYWKWRESHSADPSSIEATGGDVAVADSKQAKLCPEDGHMLIRHRVGHGLDFHVERCGHCGGIWLDLGEWEALGSSGLQSELHMIFSSAWQAQIRDEQRRRLYHEKRVDRFGEEDLAELTRIAEWLKARPEGRAMVAYLQGEVGSRGS